MQKHNKFFFFHFLGNKKNSQHFLPSRSLFDSLFNLSFLALPIAVCHHYRQFALVHFSLKLFYLLQSKPNS